MKTLVNTMTGSKDFPVFDGTPQQIKVWFESNFEHYINLNEAYSCGVDLENSTIIISGDEDYQEFEIVDLEIVTLK